MGEFDLTAPAFGADGIASWGHRPRLLDGGLQVDPSVPTSSQTTETQSPLSLGIPAITPPIAPDLIPSVINGGVPPSESASGGRVEGGQATPPVSLKEWLKLIGFSDSQIAKLTDEELEDGISLEELRRLDPSKTIITDMAYNLISRGGLGVNALGGVAADEDGIQLADIQRFLTEVVAPLVSGTGSSREVIARFLKANKFRVISRRAAARAFRESTKEKEGLWTTTDGTTTLSVKTLIDKYVRGELKGLAGKVLANILGHAVTDSDRLTEDQLANFFLTMYFVAKVDTPENIMSEARDLPELEGDSPAKLIAWLTKGAENPVQAAESSQTSGASSETRKFEGTAARDLALQEVERALRLPIPDFGRAFDIYETVQRGNGELEGVLLGGETKKVRLEMDETARKDTLGQIAQMILQYIAQKRGENDLAGLLAIYRAALGEPGYIEYEGRRIEISLAGAQRQEIIEKEARILVALARRCLTDSNGRPQLDTSAEKVAESLSYLAEAQALIEANPALPAQVRETYAEVVKLLVKLAQAKLADGEGRPRASIPAQDAGWALRCLLGARALVDAHSDWFDSQTSTDMFVAITTAIFGLSRSGEALPEEFRAQIAALRAEVVGGLQDTAFREYVKSQGLQQAQPNARNVVQLDDACLMRWKREYVARIDALLRGEAYTYRTAFGPNQSDPNRDGWVESRGPLPLELGAEPTRPAPRTSPRTGSPRAAGGRYASRISKIVDARIRQKVSGWPEEKQRQFFGYIDQRISERAAFNRLN